MMNTIVLAIVTLLVFIGCNQGRIDELEARLAACQTENQSLQEEIASRDKMMETATRIIRQTSNRLAAVNNAHMFTVQRVANLESSSHSNWKGIGEEILAQIGTMDRNLQSNSQGIDSLQRLVVAFPKQLSHLELVIADLTRINSEKQRTINAFELKVKEQLVIIGDLTKENAIKVDSIRAAKEVIVQQNLELSTKYYTYGTRSELEERGLIHNEGRVLFFGGTTVVSSVLDVNEFQSVAISTPVIEVFTEIKEILPPRDPASFRIVTPEKRAIRILNPETFWQSKFAIIITK